MMRQKGSRRVIGVLSLYVVICGVPLLAGLGYSLAYSLGLAGLLSQGMTLSHWQTLLQDRDAWGSVGYSLVLAGISMGISLSLAMGVAWLHELRPRDFLRRWLLVPLAFPPLVAGFSWYYLLSPSGILSRFAFHLGWMDRMEAFPVIVNDFPGIGLLLTHVFLVFPLFALLFMHQSAKVRMGALWQVAQSLGSKRGQFLLSVFIPLQLRQSELLIRLYAIFLIGTYEVALLMGRSSPRVMTLYITDKLGRFNLADIPQGHAMLVIYILLAGVLAFGGIKKYRML